jgi:hypothetical protein
VEERRKGRVVKKTGSMMEDGKGNREMKKEIGKYAR